MSSPGLERKFDLPAKAAGTKPRDLWLRVTAFVFLLGVFLMLAGTAFGLAGGGAWLLPGTVLACIWAARRHQAARISIGYLLLVPGVAGLFYGLVSAIESAGRAAAHGFSGAQLAFLPLALLGAWLLVTPLGRVK